MTKMDTIDCSTVLGGMSAYLDGELDSTECDVIEEHCRTCASCAAVVARRQNTIGLCRGAAGRLVPSQFANERSRACRTCWQASRSQRIVRSHDPAAMSRTGRMCPADSTRTDRHLVGATQFRVPPRGLRSAPQLPDWFGSRHARSKGSRQTCGAIS